MSWLFIHSSFSPTQRETSAPCWFSAAQIGGWTSSAERPTKTLQIPHLVSVLATGSWNGQVVGINELQAQYQKQYGPGNYIPNLFNQYSSPVSCSRWS